MLEFTLNTSPAALAARGWTASLVPGDNALHNAHFIVPGTQRALMTIEVVSKTCSVARVDIKALTFVLCIIGLLSAVFLVPGVLGAIGVILHASELGALRTCAAGAVVVAWIALPTTVLILYARPAIKVARTLKAFRVDKPRQ